MNRVPAHTVWGGLLFALAIGLFLSALSRPFSSLSIGAVAAFATPTAIVGISLLLPLQIGRRRMTFGSWMVFASLLALTAGLCFHFWAPHLFRSTTFLHATCTYTPNHIARIALTNTGETPVDYEVRATVRAGVTATSTGAHGTIAPNFRLDIPMSDIIKLGRSTRVTFKVELGGDGAAVVGECISADPTGLATEVTPFARS